MRISLVGYGRMGKIIEAIAVDRGHVIAFKIDLDNQEQLAEISPANTDVIIEFTHPEVFPHHFDQLISLGVPVVCGTTGWYDRIDQFKQKVLDQHATFMFGSNFSIGVNILFQVNKLLARLMNKQDSYDPYIEERHHKYKKDGPSGTAVSLANQVLNGLDRKTDLVHTQLHKRPPEAHELSVGYIRAGEIFGTHTVAYTSEIDSLTINHTAYSRNGFGLGAVVAAEWLQSKKGWYNFEEIFED